MGTYGDRSIRDFREMFFSSILIGIFESGETFLIEHSFRRIKNLQ